MATMTMQQEPSRFSVYVGNISYQTTVDAIGSHFSQAGHGPTSKSCTIARPDAQRASDSASSLILAGTQNAANTLNGTDFNDGGSPRMKSGNTADLCLGSLSSKELVMKAMELNKDPVIAEILFALSERIPKDLSDTIKEEQRFRSIVIANLEEADAQLRPSECQADLELKVLSILDLVKLENAGRLVSIALVLIPTTVLSNFGNREANFISEGTSPVSELKEKPDDEQRTTVYVESMCKEFTVQSDRLKQTRLRLQGKRDSMISQ
ncbi:unnamed protein product [Heligmosomoides polygyrus]|uniref:RRM domain-containing protein n=1 Tax=Heligmosomoides polygyrus TaxID=6339 RepID=A0A3P8BXB8_HELPZ|nr:unnamed protein product [Heligmosomoides polygyrus]